jgi:ABC-2 type transport system permease protein
MTTQLKPAVDHDLILAARQGLLPVSERAWLGGFGNMLRKELGQWWGTRTWWIQTLIYVLIINGITTIVTLTEQLPPGGILEQAVQTFFPMGAIVVGIGTIVTVQGAIVGEKQLGTAAWVMSKPASRSAFILAKAVAYTVGFWVSALLVPSIIFAITTRLLISAPLSMPSFLAGVALLMLNQLFYLMLTLMLGTILGSRGAITGIGIAFILSGMLLKGFIPLAVMAITPWLLPDIAAALTLGTPLPSIWFVPIVAVIGWIVVMTAVALWRFGREEF